MALELRVDSRSRNKQQLLYRDDILTIGKNKQSSLGGPAES